jgi:deoxyribose-phosphate aldolase
LTALIKNVVVSNFKEGILLCICKSSTGFYKTENSLPNGATIPSIILMLENATPLPVKAAGGVRTYEEAVEMIRSETNRDFWGKAIANGENTNIGY